MITGIGVVLKSTLGRKIEQWFNGNKKKCQRIDLDHKTRKEYQDALQKEKEDSEIVLIIESCHGLEEKMHTKDYHVIPNDPKSYNLIIYLLPPKNHNRMWARRGYEWFSEGIVDLTQGNGKKYSPKNLPSIFKKISHNFRNRKRWVEEDLERIKKLYQQEINIEIALFMPSSA